ncbi:NirA family protein [Rhodovibrio salinarum]|uniref:Ferredoxin--nitrite reductase n=1 Tax=Rhodovibrio salinarum TaxID=1087 RepID=A0A934V1U3_9PROT|nr:NirA family protein [Rhodovibrio salinarum]MBK1699013.1 ferredoxin--nitrite reductase [Rhodovibrio salinarum]
MAGSSDDNATDAPFTAEQKEYIAGFAAGTAARGLFAGHTPAGQVTNDPAAAGANLAEVGGEETYYGVPVDELAKEEQLKRAENPLDIWDKLLAHANADQPPEGGDVFRFKFHGLFYVAPAQDSFMVRLRTPGAVLTAPQVRGIAGLARDWGGGYADVTTRSNLQVRELPPSSIVEVLMTLDEIGLGARGAGADNIRNITAPPTSGFDPQEIVDVRPLCRALQHYLYNNRDMYGLPRKFNIAFDSGGAVSVLSDTNDIGFVATRVEDGQGVEPGVYFRVLLCGITGHERIAFESGLLVRPDECVPLAAAIVRAFNETGDRTNRKKARLCYVLDRLGLDAFLERVQAHLGFELRFLDAEKCTPRPPEVRHAHLGVHPQSTPGLNYIGIDVPVGRMTAEQMDALAALSEELGGGELRLTVWQNVLLPHVPDDKVDEALARISELGFSHEPHAIMGGLVACTGNTGCRYASTNTKGQAIALGQHLRDTVGLDEPLNIHLTGCPNSCAQHYIGDIGLLGALVTRAGELVEAYHVYVGGGAGQDAGIAREFAKGVPFDELPPILERLLASYRDRAEPDDSFVAFARRHDVGALRQMAGLEESP